MQGAPRAGLSRRGRGGGAAAAAASRSGFVPPFVAKAMQHHAGKATSRGGTYSNLSHVFV